MNEKRSKTRIDLPDLARLVLIAFTLTLPGLPAGATTIAPPRDLGHLARASETVVFAEAVESWAEEGPTIPLTVTRFVVVQQVAGAPVSAVFELQEPGGDTGTRAASVPGSPRFEGGTRYLLFLDRAPAGRWRSKALAWGLLEEIPGAGLLVPMPELRKIERLSGRRSEPLGVFKKEALLRHLSEVARGAAWNRQEVVALPSLSAELDAAHQGPAECAFLNDSGDGRLIRWFDFETDGRTMAVAATTPGQTGLADGGTGAVAAGIAAWNGHRDAKMRASYEGTRPRAITCSGSFDIEQGAVVFNDPCDDLSALSGCVGTLAFGGALYDSAKTRLHDGEPWHPAISAFVVVNEDAGCVGEKSFEEAISHELGHGLGFGHHAPADPADALMSSQLKGDGLGAALRPTDRSCAAVAYHTFLDVAPTSGYWPFIEAIENAGVTKGCGGGRYCPDLDVTRAEMAVFLVRASHGDAYVPPPATGKVFSDVPASYWAAAHIEQLFHDGITKGCGAGVFCPEAQVQRTEMSAFLVRARYGSDYRPPAATGQVFTDVPASHWAAPFIEQLYRDDVTKGCALNPPRYCPEDLVSRAQMAAFLARTFELPLP
jgi:hypothetical protein